ncbi:hypothetical protein niasHS_002456 [Heterodera schachtii]|uniref:Uncharacterized protein n=1 Tax=Heterodera schachtii TaxID=97005 RepID=A0ABD2KKW5_HETSC
MNAPKRHNSVSFTDPSILPTECQNRTKWRSYSTNFQSNCHPHGSLLSFVMRHKVKNGGPSREAAMFAVPSSIPSLPVAILQAIIGPNLKKGHSSGTFSLDGEGPSAFSSVCSSSASTTGAQSNAFGRTSECQLGTTPNRSSDDFCVCPSPWKYAQSEEKETNGYLFILHSNWALQKERMENRRANGDGAILCAEGNTQAHLLSLVAPWGKRVVNVGRSTGDETVRSGDCHRLFSHNPNNLNPYE